MILAIVRKLLLSLDMQVRGLRSIMLDCTQLPTNCDYVQQGYAETKKWNEKFQKLKEDGLAPQKARDTLGLPHVHLWNALLRVLKARLTAAQKHE